MKTFQFITSVLFIFLISGITYAEEWRRVMPSPEEEAREQRQEAQELRGKQIKKANETKTDINQNLIDLEKRRIQEKRCNSPSGKWNSYCEEKKQKALAELDNDPEYYFYKQPHSPQTPSGNHHHHAHADDNDENSRGAIDVRTGQYLPPVAGGVIDPQTGTFHNKVAGGYINSKTGEFMPKTGP